MTNPQQASKRTSKTTAVDGADVTGGHVSHKGDGGNDAAQSEIHNTICHQGFRASSAPIRVTPEVKTSILRIKVL